MELDELEKIWKRAGHQSLQKGDVEKMLQQKSGNEITRMRTNLLVELLVVLASVVAVSVFYFLVLNGRLQEIGWLYMLLAGVFVAYYYAKNRLLKNMLSNSGNIRQNLEQQLKRLDTYIRYYLLAGSLLVPGIMAIFYFLLDYKEIPLRILGVSRGSHSFALLYFLFTMAFTFGLYIFNKWNVNLLYGKYIKRLKSLLSELNEQ